MPSRIIRIVFIVTTILFALKVAAHGLLFFQDVAWVARFTDESMVLPAILDPVNLPLLGCLFGLVSLIIYCRAQSKGIPIKAPCYQIVLPFVYVLAWMAIFVYGWSRLT